MADVVDHPAARPRSPEDGYPSGGITIEQEINCIRYELLVRRPLGKFVVVIRCYEPSRHGEDGEFGLSVRSV